MTQSKDGPLEQYYDEHIMPLVSQIRALCDEKGIDYILHFVLDATKEGYRCGAAVNISRPDLDDLILGAAVLHGEIELVPLDTDDPMGKGDDIDPELPWTMGEMQ